MALGRCLLVSGLFLGAAISAFPQGGESTEILGVVQDVSGALVPGVTITITHVATNQSRRMVTGDSGAFAFPSIQPGVYNIRAECPGFRTEIRTGLEVQLNQKARINFSIQVGQVTESVEVTAAAALLNTDDATLGNVVEQRRVVDLPLNGRNFANLAGLMPGVIKGISSNTNQYGRRDSAIAVSANGMRENQGQVLYDGVYTAWNINNATFFRASIEAIQEFKVHAGSYSAEYGHNAGAQVEIHTRPPHCAIRSEASSRTTAFPRAATILSRATTSTSTRFRTPLHWVRTLSPPRRRSTTSTKSFSAVTTTSAKRTASSAAWPFTAMSSQRLS